MRPAGGAASSGENPGPHGPLGRAHLRRPTLKAAWLLEWRPGDGWAPIAAALGLPVPDSPFPKVNSREQFRIPDFGESADVAATS